MSTKKNYIFFLGGNDLEMLEIRKIHEQRKYTFYDKNLLWGCKASEYDNELKNLKEDEIAVLLELQIDIDIPQNSIIVDHHNEKEGNESSLKRIADLLGISLTRQQELISANDKGFIPAMEKLCATEKEILEIRKLDRKAQGVTEEDEKNAEESIEKNKSEEKSVTIIKSKTDKFSPIVDRMYKKTDNLLIYNDDKLTFYGKRKTKVVELLVQKKIKLYYGGGERGYVGIGNGELSKEEILNVKDEIVDMNLGNEEDIYSYHIFLFPFKWQRWDLELKTLKNKFSIEYFECELLKGEWNRERFKLDYRDHYNEFN